MRTIRGAALLAVGAVALAGCSSGDADRTARLEAQVATLKDQITSTTVAPTTTTAAPTTTTTTTLAPTTTTTVRPSTTTTTRKPAAATTTTLKAPWCTAQATSSTVTKGAGVVVLVSSNLPGRAASVGLRNVATMAPNGTGSFTLTAPGGWMDQYGHYSPKTNTVEVKFYDGAPPTIDQLLDGPAPALLTSCKTSYISVGP